MWYNGHGNGGGNSIFRLREGIERFMISDINNPGTTAKAQSNLAIMWDYVTMNVKAYNHIPGGSNVLFLDGHVKFMKYPSDEFPVNKGWAGFHGPWFNTPNCWAR